MADIMLTKSILSDTLSFTTFIVILAVIQIVSYLITRPIFDYSSIITIIILVLVAIFVPYGNIFSFFASTIILLLPKIHFLYKIGAGTFMILMLLTLVVN